ncbi:MAG: TlpA family protein disulfide reductase [Crocinitomicaceae bacterium]|nr:TlpA family protein disulfide reductase [Crocinitomicaceae bacterium]
MIRDAYKKTYPDNAMTKMIAEQIDQVKSGHENFVQFNVEKSAPEIALRDPDGRTRKLSDLKGKYVLIDFWASWCNPCRMENPNVVRLYKQYQNKNFDIFSVSLDNDKNRWVKAIAADGLIWKNHVSDLKGWESAVVPLYGVKGIPHTVLIDPKGKIIETNLRGAKLEQKLKELFD